MNSRVYSFDLNLSIPGSTEISAMEYVQGDTGVNGMNIRLLDGEEEQPIDLTGCLVTVIAKRSDGHSTEKMLIKEDAVNGEVTWEMDKADVSVPGSVTVSVQIYDGYDARLTSEFFEYVVKAELSGDEEVAASSEYDLYINARHCGDYSDTTRYFMNNIVAYAGASYMALCDTEDNAPTDTAYWALVSDRGEPGPGIDWKGEYDAETAYQVADGVSYQGLAYICVQACTGQTPEAGSAYWNLFAEKDAGACPSSALYIYQNLGGSL
jgi:hypothetical protein